VVGIREYAQSCFEPFLGCPVGIGPGVPVSYFQELIGVRMTFGVNREKYPDLSTGILGCCHITDRFGKCDHLLQLDGTVAGIGTHVYVLLAPSVPKVNTNVQDQDQDQDQDQENP
jgi:hypothetical protein